MKLIDNDAVMSVIDEKLSYYKDLESRGLLSKEGDAAFRAVRILKSDINILEVKEVDLDTAFGVCWGEYCDCGGNINDYKIAKHFFELGLRSTITEEDVKRIWNIGDEIPYIAEEDFFKELLRRYKTQKIIKK